MNLELNKSCCSDIELNHLRHENAMLRLQLQNVKLQGDLEISNMKTKYNSMIAIIHRSMNEEHKNGNLDESHRILKNAMKALRDIVQ